MVWSSGAGELIAGRGLEAMRGLGLPS